ncbi:hypothetical protein ACTJNK_26000 [Achromobacter anxifer]
MQARSFAFNLVQKEVHAVACSAAQTGGMDKITETEKLLQHAQDIARRTFVDPSEKAVLAIFDELRAERDRMGWAIDGRDSAAVH